jgi:hypothetical protein
MGGMSLDVRPHRLRGAPGGSSRQSRRFALAGRSSYSKEVDAGWSSSVARWAHNPEVVGSNPTPATKTEAGSEQGSGFLCYWIVVLHNRMSDPLRRSIPKTDSASW